MENNWPETVDELLGECQRLISKSDLYTLGERGEPFSGETEPRVDGTEYLAGEHQYGVAMIPAQWVTHVIEAATLGGVGSKVGSEVGSEVCGGKLTAEQVMAIAGRHQPDYCSDTHVCFDWQAIADELNATMGGGECVFEINTDATAIKCSSCGYSLPKGTDLDDTRFCGGCGQAVKR